MSDQPTLPRIPLLNLARQTAALRERIDAAIAAVVDHGQYILGPEVAELERQLAAYCGVRYAVSCASGSDALLLPLMALGAGPGDRVITVPFTFFATAGSISRLGATPAFVDIDPETFNMDPDCLARYLSALSAEEILTVKAIIPVHLFGQCAPMDRILAIAARYSIPVIEDAAQAIGADFQGQRAGSMGLCGTLSFFPSKNLGGAGDGGMITTNDAAFAEKLRVLRCHGGERRYYHKTVGINSRLDSLQAAILLAKLPSLDKWTNRRIANAEFYEEQLQGLPAEKIRLPRHAGTGRHIYNQYTLRLAARDAVRDRFSAAGVSSEIYYPLSLHLQECFAPLGYKPGDFPESEKASAEVLSIPIDAELNQEEKSRVAQALREAVTA